jgi:hypothetical protein
MNVTDKFQKVGIFLDNKALITILKKMPLPFVPSIEIHSVTGQKFAHQTC